MDTQRDPFRQQREETGIEYMRAEGDDMPLILRLQDVRKTCKDWKTFSNDDPFMIVPHSEANVRSVRQYPIETDPPDHTDYRALVEPFFARPNDPGYQLGMRKLVDEILAAAAGAESVEVVREVALPLQSRSLTRLLNVDESEADLWISWGTHVFKEGDGVSKGAELGSYIRQKFETAEGSHAGDFFSVLNRIDFRGRKLTLEEKHGFANMAFAGGRDTVIHTVSSIIAYFAEHLEGLDFLRQDGSRIISATEEFVRYVSPLTAIARKCPHGAQVLDAKIAPGGRVGLCWPSANRDETAFTKPQEVVLDRSPNPHVGFGFGIHKCLGAAQARLIIRSLLQSLCDQIESIKLIEAVPEVEHESSFERQVGYKRLHVSFTRKTLR
jgi:cytochrome P450